MARFIPACAGNTAAVFRTSAAIAVHPRVCGEHFMTNVPFALSFGSSPRVRGTRASSNIPLFVGGSSPRVRGTLVTKMRRCQYDRFIPACAGNTPHSPARRPLRPVHPRVCGEHHSPASKQSTVLGSSPRVRGTPNEDDPENMFSRFIPACAGNTCPDRSDSLQIPVHPRVCGEHTYSRNVVSSAAGSSPRVRGTLLVPAGPSLIRRFIPACAGNTTTHRERSFFITVHPRVCGEHRRMK